MTYLVDTDYLVSFLNGRPAAVELIEQLAVAGISVSIVSYGEICEGFEGRPDARERLAQLDRVLEVVDLVTLDREIAVAYASLRSELRSRGQLIPDNDLWLAATALARNLTLVSRDRHFERLPRVKRY